MYFIGIDISKYKHDCCIISAADQKVVSKVTIKNNISGFDELLTIIKSLSNPEDIRIGFESTAHYALNLELFLEKSLLSFMEVNPVLISEYKKSRTLRRTKTDSVDCVETHTITLNRPEMFGWYGLLSGGTYNPDEVKDTGVKGIFIGCGSKEGPDMIRNAAKALQDAGFNAKGYVSEGTAHEFLTWRRCLYEMAPMLFKK